MVVVGFTRDELVVGYNEDWFRGSGGVIGMVGLCGGGVSGGVGGGGGDGVLGHSLFFVEKVVGRVAGTILIF